MIIKKMSASRNWNIIITVAEHDNKHEDKVWNYLAELGYENHQLSTNVVFHFLIEVPSGTYQMCWKSPELCNSTSTDKLIPRKISSKCGILCCVKSISSFITWATQKDPAKHYAFFYCGGGFGFYTENEDKCPMSILKWEKCLQALGTPWDIVGFDCCLLASLETCYQLCQVTKWIIACETYEPDEGMHSKEMVRAFENYTNPRIIGQIIISSFIRRVNRDKHADPANMSLLKTRNVPKLVKYLVKLPLEGIMRTAPKNASWRIDPIEEDGNEFYDLWSFICYAYSKGKISLRNKNSIHKLLKKIVVYYKESQKLKCTNYMEYGLSFCGNSHLDSFTDKNYRELYAEKNISWLDQI